MLNVCYLNNVSHRHTNLIETIDAFNPLTSVFLSEVVFVNQHARAGLRQQSLIAAAERQDDNNQTAAAASAAFPRLSCGQFLRATITRHQYACGRRAQSGHHPPAPLTPLTPLPPRELFAPILPPWEPRRCMFRCSLMLLEYFPLIS